MFVIICLHFFLTIHCMFECLGCCALLCFFMFSTGFYGVLNYVLSVLLSFHCFTGFDHSFMGMGSYNEVMTTARLSCVCFCVYCVNALFSLENLSTGDGGWLAGFSCIFSRLYCHLLLSTP